MHPPRSTSAIRILKLSGAIDHSQFHLHSVKVQSHPRKSRTLDGAVVGPPTIIALDPSRCKKDATEAATAVGEATIYYEKAYDSTDAGGTELDLIQKSDMPYEIIIGPNSDSPMSVRID